MKNKGFSFVGHYFESISEKEEVLTMQSKVFYLKDNGMTEEELKEWLNNREWEELEIEYGKEIIPTLDMIIGGRIFYYDVCDLKDNNRCSAVMIGIVLDDGHSNRKRYVLVVIEAWDSEESLIQIGDKYLFSTD